MRIEVINQLESIPATAWNRVSGTGHPFLRHEFLVALERHNCVGEAYGWLPRHLAAYDEDDRLCGVVPLYLKNNSMASSCLTGPGRTPISVPDLPTTQSWYPPFPIPR
ncbi:MAG: GNAT family N-acetyltransferase [Gammaproteobacteria bacterium]|nr:GNAT family N-acetyltransferase [Gammaproteobacteria bacterium]